MKEHSNTIFTIPNILTMLRIIMVPIFIYCYMNMESIYSAIVVLLSGLTDFLDGYIARMTNTVSELGKKLDPIADKLLQLAIVFCLTFTLKYMILVCILFLIKESAMFICYVYMRKKGGYINGALWFGKVSTAVFYAATFLLIALPIQNTIYSSVLMLLTAGFLIISFILYMATYATMFKKLK